MRIGLIVAMDKEMAQLENLLSDRHEDTVGHLRFVCGRIGDKEVVLQKCGIGKVNSAVGTVEMIGRYHPDLIISSGCAGGADSTLHVGDVVVATACAYHDAYCGDDCEYGQIMGLPTYYPTVTSTSLADYNKQLKDRLHYGLIVSGEWFVNSREKMQAILNRFPEAKAIDMESCSIAQTCYLYGVDFVSFRVISDVPLCDHKAQMYYDFWDRMANGSFEVTRDFISSLPSDIQKQ